MRATLNRECWTQETPLATHFDGEVMVGLNNPVWRKSYDLHSGDLLESRSIDEPTTLQYLVKDGPKDLKTQVWYGKNTGQTKTKSSLRSNLKKGISMATSIFLLEAVVLMAAGANWSGSWTQQLYGTGEADVWEVFGDHGSLTYTAWRQGWRPLEPYTTTNSQFNTTCSDYINATLEERAPRLVVIECPDKLWNWYERGLPQHVNARRQHEKTLRSRSDSFFAAAQHVAMSQLQEQRDFLLETPLKSIAMHNPLIKEMVRDERIGVTDGDLAGFGNREHNYSTWWLTSSPEILQHLGQKRPRCTELAKDVLIALSLIHI